MKKINKLTVTKMTMTIFVSKYKMYLPIIN